MIYYLRLVVIAIGLFLIVLYAHAINPQSEDYLKSGTIFFQVSAQENDLLKNPYFSLVNKTTNLPSYWNDIVGNCKRTFECKINSTQGWNKNGSLQISTQGNSSEVWSAIHSNEIQVEPYEIYEIQGHVKLNNFAVQSHIAVGGYNESSHQWYQIIQCPPGTNGPMEWKSFVCKIIIPPETKTIDVILNAGWSSQRDRKAVTLFDALHVYRTR